MSFDDEILGKLFPTRQGEAIGSANERQMLDKTGAEGFHKSYRTMPDGSQVRCETKNGMPQFIRTGGSTVVEGCSLEMDTGVVDLVSISDYSARLQDPGLVYHTDYVAAHVGEFTESVGTGKIKHSKYTGPVIPSGSVAKAFSSDYKGATLFTNRKKIAARIPPSLFTGRMRLYVQSLYGGTWDELTLADISWGVGRPILSVNTLSREENGLQPAYIGSGTGLFFDAATKRHYLIVLTTSTAYISPLISTPCAEKYRELLISSPISAEEEERIEAYILSQSVPAHEKAQVLTFEETPNEAMGYGWHFNWSGTCCDIIDVQEKMITEGGSNTYGFSSTHYRLTFSSNNGVFSVQRTVVSAPVEWSVPKHFNVIAYPLWVEKKLIKAGNLPSKVLANPKSAKVYCFYARDELKVVTVDTRTIPLGEKSRKSSPEYFGGRNHYYWTLYILDKENGETVGRNSLGGAECRFSIANAVFGGNTDRNVKDVTSAAWAGRLDDSFYQTGTTVFPEGTSYDVDYGMPTVTYSVKEDGQIDSISFDWNEKETINGLAQVNSTMHLQHSLWEVTGRNTTEINTSQTLVIIPFYDAEAVFLSEKITTAESGMSYNYCAGTSHLDAILEFSVLRNGVPDEKLGPLERFYLSTFPLSYIHRTQEYELIDTTETSSSRNIVSSIGTFSVGNMPSEGVFYSNTDTVDEMYMTLSSVNGVIFSERAVVESGAASFPENMVFIGWA